MRPICIILVVLASTFTVNSQDTAPFESFKANVRTAWANGDHDQAIELLQKSKDLYIENIQQHTILYYLGLLYLETEDYEQSFKTFNKGFKQRFFFSFWPQHLSKIKRHPNGKAIIQQNVTNKTVFEKKSEIKYEVIYPKNYDSKLKYPLLYFLHGNNSNLKFLKSKWNAIKLSSNLIVVLLQSSSPKSNYTFNWPDSASDNTIIQKVHAKLVKEYPIDSTKVILAGFSNGGRKAIDLFSDQAFPIMGFIAFNPSKTTKNKPNNLKAPPGRGVIITGEKDYMLASQVLTANDLLSQSFPLRLVVLPNHGHDYPDGFEEEVNNSIEFIFEDE